MILSASRRTDIPCYYSEWIVNRLKAGHVLTRNPFNNSQLSKISLSPHIVDCIVFWTKDANSIISHLSQIDGMGYKYYFQFTLTPYDKAIEQNLRAKKEIIKTFIELSQLIGKDKVVWRYDPIILNENLTVDWHKEQFSKLCDTLSPYTNSVVISFVDLYSKIKNPLIREISEDEIAELSLFIGETAKKYGITARACSEKADLVQYGITKSSCIDREMIEKACGFSMDIKADKNQRAGCGCLESIDIGAYNTCLNHCIYCYANDSFTTTQRRYDKHNPAGELLLGEVLEGEKITERKVKSNKIYQLEF